MQLIATDPVSDHADDRSGHRHRQLIGWIGLILPALLIVIVLLRDGPEVYWQLDSVSAYYYTGAVTPFVGMLVSIALFLFTYRGYDNKYQWADRLAAWLTGIAAIGVAAFPTKAPIEELTLPWWTELTGEIHLWSAVALFVLFAVFSGILFCLGSKKTWRKWVYRVCAVVIVLCMIWMVVAARRDEAIFWPETFALAAFSISWLVKGEAQRSIMNSIRAITGRAGTN